MRTHYQRRDLELLFRLQPRAAQKLIEMLPRTEVGTALIVERDHLAEFLARVRDSKDVTKLFEEIRRDPPPVVRHKIRTQLLYEKLDLLALPSSIYLKRGKLEVTFRTAIELAEAMLAIAKIIETEEFARDYTRGEVKPAAEPSAVREVRQMFEELEQMEAARQPIM